MKKFFILPLIAIASSSCAMQELYLNVMQPAPVTIAPEIKTIGIIDRSNPTDQTKTLDMLDKLFTLEGAELDSIGTLEAIKGVTEELKNNDRFTGVKLLDNLKGKVIASGPEHVTVLLSWLFVRCISPLVKNIFFAMVYELILS